MRIIIIVHCVLASLMILFSVPGVYAPINIEVSLEKLPIGPSVEFFADDTGALTTQEVSNPGFGGRWSHQGEENPGFGFSRSVARVRFSIGNAMGRVYSLPSMIIFPCPPA
ncbi:MAG: hypothetical protein E4G96_00840 [Chrysiogenales bacterium]|nr:MAG: hypothetical protein E4G96_00840 [Chrysiogenales bacterium]